MIVPHVTLHPALNDRTTEHIFGSVHAFELILAGLHLADSVDALRTCKTDMGRILPALAGLVNITEEGMGGLTIACPAREIPLLELHLIKAGFAPFRDDRIPDSVHHIPMEGLTILGIYSNLIWAVQKIGPDEYAACSITGQLARLGDKRLTYISIEDATRAILSALVSRQPLKPDRLACMQRGVFDPLLYDLWMKATGCKLSYPEWLIRLGNPTLHTIPGSDWGELWSGWTSPMPGVEYNVPGHVPPDNLVNELLSTELLDLPSSRGEKKEIGPVKTQGPYAPGAPDMVVVLETKSGKSAKSLCNFLQLHNFSPTLEEAVGSSPARIWLPKSVIPSLMVRKGLDNRFKEFRFDYREGPLVLEALMVSTPHGKFENPFPYSLEFVGVARKFPLKFPSPGPGVDGSKVTLFLDQARTFAFTTIGSTVSGEGQDDDYAKVTLTEI